MDACKSCPHLVQCLLDPNFICFLDEPFQIRIKQKVQQ